MKILVIATATGQTTSNAVYATLSRFPDAEITVAVTEPIVDKMDVPKNVQVWIAGESYFQFDEPLVRKKIAEADYGLFVIPLDFLQGFQRIRSAVRLIRDGYAKKVMLHWGSRFSPVVSPKWARRLLLTRSFLYHYIGCGIGRVLQYLDLALVLSLPLLLRLRRKQPSGADATKRGTVCHVIPTFGTGGAQRQLLEYLANAPNGPATIKVIALHHVLQFFDDDVRATGVQVTDISNIVRESKTLFKIKNYFPMCVQLYALTRELKRQKPDCVFSWLFYANMVSSIASRAAGIPRVYTSVRSTSEWMEGIYGKCWYHTADKLTAPLPDKITGNSEAVANDYAKWACVSRDRVHVIYNGINVEKFETGISGEDIRKKYNIPADMPVMLAVGRLADPKNFFMFIRVMGELRDRGVDCRGIIVGHGDLDQQLYNLTNELSLQDRIIFPGKSSTPQDFYRAADIYLMTSKREGFPNVVMEAMIFRLPVVATPAGGTVELVGDGKSGLIVPHNDHKAMADKVQVLLADPALRKNMGEAGRERIINTFSIHKMVGTIDEITQRKTIL